MADFKAHFIGAATVGGVGATAFLSAGLLDSQGVCLCFSTAILGGLLPDLDADSSTPLAIGFTLMEIFFAFLVMFSQVNNLSVLELVLLWFGVFAFFKLVVFTWFTRLTLHRGIFHSLPAAFFCGFLVAATLHRLFGLTSDNAWFGGAFAGCGYFVHLCMDELSSLNVLGTGGVRASLGSAIKLYSRDYLATVGIYAALAAAFLLTPVGGTLWIKLMKPGTWELLASRLLPHGHIFGLSWTL